MLLPVLPQLHGITLGNRHFQLMSRVTSDTLPISFRLQQRAEVYSEMTQVLTLQVERLSGGAYSGPDAHVAHVLRYCAWTQGRQGAGLRLVVRV
jgi:hypothetical protein